MKNTLTPSATPMPVSSFFCDQFQNDARETRRHLNVMGAILTILSAISMWLAHLK